MGKINTIMIKKNITLLFTFFVLLFAASCSSVSMEFYVFSDIAECINIHNLPYGDAVITEYDSPAKDKYLGQIRYDNFYAAQYSSEKLSFEIYAYEFKSPDDAQQYFTNVTGKTHSAATNFSESKGMGSYRLVVIDSEKAYIATTSADQSEQLKQCLGSVFSKKISHPDGSFEYYQS